MGSYTESYVWSIGDAVESLEFDIIFDCDLSDSFSFLFQALREGNVMERVIAYWNDSNWEFRSSVPDADIMYLLGPALIGLGLIGRRKYKNKSPVLPGKQICSWFKQLGPLR